MYKFALGTAAACLALATSAAAEDTKAPTARSLDGAWTVVCYEKDGRPQADARGMTVKAEAGTLTCSGKDGKAAMTMRVVLGPNGTVQVTEGTGDAAAPAARAGVYVLTQDFLAISVNEAVTTGADPKPVAADGQGGKARCNVILQREAPTPGVDK